MQLLWGDWRCENEVTNDRGGMEGNMRLIKEEPRKKEEMNEGMKQKQERKCLDVNEQLRAFSGDDVEIRGMKEEIMENK